ncbi:MarR family winged helix-turn-helix transcriptional regulator [Qaidamihabitans albus]|uniref:MarR family winged helix-turn-helix transcriptional regulator n=1 Tax=Qaidamihabitans albus TaxID=2795733 RepID=UPI0018F15787|nr:hypothetical protein [Qaidamihabitans albus]
MVLGSSHVSSAAYENAVLGKAAEANTSLDERSMRVGFNLVRVANAFVQLTEDRVHRPRRWSWAAFRTMLIIWHLESVEGRSLARLTGLSRQTSSSVLATLERRCLVERDPCNSHDRRLVTFRLSERGRVEIEQALKEQNALETESFAPLSPEEKDTLIHLLHKLLGLE